MTPDTRDKLIQKQANASLVHMNGEFLFPFIERRIQETLDQMSHDFKAQDGHAHVDSLKVAYIVALKDLKEELAGVIRQGASAVIKLDR